MKRSDLISDMGSTPIVSSGLTGVRTPERARILLISIGRPTGDVTVSTGSVEGRGAEGQSTTLPGNMAVSNDSRLIARTKTAKTNLLTMPKLVTAPMGDFAMAA